MGLFDWFQSRPVCPVDAATRDWIDQRWGWLEDQFGIERVRRAPVVLPRAEFFPDAFDGTTESIRRMLDRMCGYMELDPGSIELSLFREEHSTFVGLYHPEGDKFRIWIEARNLPDPLSMAATMAHELGHVHLLGHGRISADAEDHEPLTDLLTVYFGLGALTANAVIREYHDYSRWAIRREGYFTMPMFGYALARFALTRGEDGAKWSRELRPDVRSAFKQSLRFLLSETVGDMRNRTR
ncbi:MAG: hypothetical protein KF774_12805 [Planctomyces sp.]|nr:hypothetical protein [Planctomyces sp.]